MDPIQVLTHALSLPGDSTEQSTLFAQLREYLESQPASIPVLCTTLLANVVSPKDSAFKLWLIDLLQFALSRSTLPVESKALLAFQTVEPLHALMNDATATTIKLVVQCFASAYPHLFRYLCENRHNSSAWDVMSRAKERILSMVDSPRAPIGVQVAAIKFMQRVILVQSRGVSDPRVVALQNKADPNVGICPPNHPFMNVRQLEEEGTARLSQMVGMLYSCQDPDILTAVLNCFVILVKLRPQFVQLMVTAMASWTPVRLENSSASIVKSVEKAARIVMVHIMRHGFGGQYQAEVTQALAAQQARMDEAAREEQARRADASRKRTLPEPSVDPSVSKKPKTEIGTTAVAPAVAQGLLASFDFTTLPLALVTELVINNLLAIDPVSLNSAVTSTSGPIAPTPAPTSAPTPAQGPFSAPAAPNVSRPGPSVKVTEEILDPLKIELDEDEIEYEPEKLNSNLEVSPKPESNCHSMLLISMDFELPPARILSEDERNVAVKTAIDRIRSQADGSQRSVEPTEHDSSFPDSPLVRLPASEAWVLLLVRMTTRGPAADMGDGAESGSVVFSPRQDIRKILCDYVLDDFTERYLGLTYGLMHYESLWISRSRLATIWMNEEWYNDVIRREEDPNWQPQYDLWVQKLLMAQKEKLDPKDKAFSRFLVDLPALPPNLLSLLRDLCLDPDIMPVGFTSFRELVTLRPPVRTEAMQILLDLTTHPDKVIRGAAIITVRRWVPDQQPMDQSIRSYARGMLRRLATKDGPATDADEAVHEPESVSSYLPPELVLPASKAVILQHVELLLGLAVKLPEFLDQIFNTYGQTDASVQEALKGLIVPLIKTLGPNNPKLLDLLRTFPADAEFLALRILGILTENARPSPALVSLTKDLIAERELDPGFLVIVIPEMDKADILKHLPRMVATLDGTPEKHERVRKVFSNVVSESPSGTSSNMPRVRQSERLAPAELMVMLHEQEKEIGLKGVIEAIGICFAMPDVFRSETLGVVMQQIMDEPTLPKLFMRTVIQAVTTYKNLVSFVTTTLFSRLIVKKIWTNGPLWDGFMRCAKVTAPSSFGALLQLPKDQLREVVDKQPSLRSGLRDYVIKKERSKPKLASFLETLGDGGEVITTGEAPSGTPPPAPPPIASAVSPNA
ncbi:hypothetical protein FRB98_003668 [Tulasnella sp. 332]|nr:hypothetical protein FRB98_003668 [Tulasnella sp. 332]